MGGSVITDLRLHRASVGFTVDITGFTAGRFIHAMLLKSNVKQCVSVHLQSPVNAQNQPSVRGVPGPVGWTALQYPTTSYSRYTARRRTGLHRAQPRSDRISYTEDT
ncbi:hypothetical protein INR49_002644 [Caranx melampygus]|nr:hypothetical protein INR49_002644 [Caranx melampygus]